MDWIGDVYLVCAVVGGTILVVQTIMLAFGASGDHDTPSEGPDVHAGDSPGHAIDHSESLFVKMLSLKTIVSFLTFFGLAGLAGGRAAWPDAVTLAIAIVAGASGFFVVGWLMASFVRLQGHGNLDLKNAVGATGKVYLRIPGSLSGSGKVTVEVQGRSVEARAVTAATEIPTGTPIRVLAVDGDLLEVAPLK